MTDWTYGAELEWPDVDVQGALLANWSWSRSDYTVVNSDGTANDPLHELVLRGGELNSPALGSPETLARQCDLMRKMLNPGHNYRSNLHIHVRVPELEKLDELKRVAEYVRTHLPRMLPHFDSLDGLLTGLEDPEEIAAAEKRRKHSEKSRHYFISDARHEVRMAADDLESFLRAEVPVRGDGTPLWHLAPREAVNFRSLRKHGTVEFRCFAGDANADNVYAAACFARDLLYAALNDLETYALPYFWELPKQLPFEKRLEDGWAWTNLKDNKRDVVRERLAELGKLPEPECA